jgi:hypothetical protein
MVNTPWDVEGWFVGTVHGEAVNCKFQFRVGDTGLTEIWVREEHDVTRQSTISRSPDIASMAHHVILEFQHAAEVALVPNAADPVPPRASECQVTFLHDYRPPAQPDPASFESDPAPDRVRVQLR